MTTETMNIHKALAELKSLDKRIPNLIRECDYCVTNKVTNEKINGYTIDEVRDLIKSDYQKIIDLMKRRDAIKRAVVASNAETEVTIAGVKYTVAVAIEMKNHGMDYKKLLLQCMTSDHVDCSKSLAANNGERLEKAADDYVANFYGSKEKAAKTEEAMAMREQYIRQRKYELIDPLNVITKIAELSDEIEKFMSEVDGALSTSNANTTIEITY